jgi:D-alanyl-lipoteichoic acid acyltransferase DltB (MBOAT superfamily)
VSIQNLLVLVASLIFYGWWNWKFVFLILLSVIVNYAIGIAVDRAETADWRKRAIVFGVAFNLILLATFKYTAFLLDSLIVLLASVGVDVPEIKLHILLPVGISFFTFQAMSYIIDVHKGRVACERSLIKFGAYISLFPQLVAGPIVRSDVLLPQMGLLRKFSWPNLWLGLEMFVIGAALKILVANRLGPVVDQVFLQYSQQDPLSILLGTIFFAFQIYGDFAGYSLMAIGLGRIMGLRFPANFKRPYLAKDFSDFWQRWHISLSTWLRDYLYIPLGGNRQGEFKQKRNLMITMILGGLWHGASWSFVFWGVLHGAYQVVQIYVRRLNVFHFKKFKYIELLIKRLIVFTLVCVAWVFFRVTDFSAAVDILHAMLDFSNYSIAAVGNKFNIAFGLIIIAVLMAIELVNEDTGWLKIYRHVRAIRILWILTLVQILILFGSFSDNAFIYFQF